MSALPCRTATLSVTAGMSRDNIQLRICSWKMLSFVSIELSSTLFKVQWLQMFRIYPFVYHSRIHLSYKSFGYLVVFNKSGLWRCLVVERITCIFSPSSLYKETVPTSQQAKQELDSLSRYVSGLLRDPDKCRPSFLILPPSWENSKKSDHLSECAGPGGQRTCIARKMDMPK